jgi:hypothetical protein
MRNLMPKTNEPMGRTLYDDIAILVVAVVRIVIRLVLKV